MGLSRTVFKMLPLNIISSKLCIIREITISRVEGKMIAVHKYIAVGYHIGGGTDDIFGGGVFCVK